MPLDRSLNELSTASPILVNYTSNELITARSIIKFLGYTTLDSVATKFLLSDKVNYSSAVKYMSGSFSSTGEIINQDVDVAFGQSAIIEGDAILTLAIHSTNTSRTGNFHTDVTLIHYDGTTETVLGTAQTLARGTTTSNDYYDEVIGMTLPRTKFRKGDILRVNITMTVNSVGGSGVSQHRVYLDPNNATVGTLQTTQFIIDTPFRRPF